MQKNNGVKIQSYLLAFKLGWNSGEEVSTELNSFQLLARWWYTELQSVIDDGVRLGRAEEEEGKV